MAFKEACSKGGSILLEPIMDVEVVCSGEFLGDVLGRSDCSGEERSSAWRAVPGIKRLV